MKKITFFYEHIINTCFMGKTKLLLSILLMFICLSVKSQTFTWDTATTASSGGVSVASASETVSGITCTFTAVNTSSGANLPSPVILGDFQQGTTGNSVSHQDPDAVAILSFSSPVDIQGLNVFDVGGGSANSYTFTPSGANVQGSAITVSVGVNASGFNPNWSNVENILITDTQNNTTNSIGIDDIVFSLPTVCTVNIPDANLKEELLAVNGIDTNNNNEIECAEASAYTGLINLTGLFGDISDYTGLEAFTEITSLGFSSASASSVNTIDLSSNTKIESLVVWNEPFTSLDISDLVALEELNFNSSQLTTIDLSSNVMLRDIQMLSGNETTMDLSDLTTLESVLIGDGQLASVTFTNNLSLTEVNLRNNQITSIDVSALSALEELNVRGNQIAAINVTQNTSLESLIVFNNNLATIDVSQNAALITLAVGDNNLSDIDVTQNINLGHLGVSENSNISTLDVSQNSVLTSLALGGNNLQSLDLSQNANLMGLTIRVSTNFTTIDLSNNTNLSLIEVYNSALTALDLSANSLLEEVYINDNTNLTSLNLANANNSIIVSADLSNNTNLTCIQIDANFTPSSSIWYKDASASYSDDCAALSIGDYNVIDFKLYPNPAYDILIIESNKTIKALEIYSVTGKRLTVMQNTNRIDVSALHNGMYFIKIYSEDESIASLKFLKE
ncbi:T9SS type A sorting domain-containing protein [Winogradskyella sp. 4-2091]|uniref:T9SS type A sorting domain-containing protein n=1 Tax=Winogradskyella sp. 4-2091 TaxID=3381659 RepID=UPI0038925398